jgi:F0F1-type ATP synthase assembly protein I
MLIGLVVGAVIGLLLNNLLGIHNYEQAFDVFVVCALLGFCFGVIGSYFRGKK